jgi:glutamyl endopeptidase
MNDFFTHTDNNLLEEIVLLKDDRKKVRDTTRAPFHWICSLEVEFPEPVLYPLGTLEHPGKGWKDLKPSRKGCGTGLLITPQHVLTASHVVAGLKVVKDPKTGKDRFKVVTANKVTVIPGRNEEAKGNARPFGAYVSQRILVNPGFISAMALPVDRLTKAQVRRALSADFGIVEVQEKRNARDALLPGLSAGWWGEEETFRMAPVEGTLRQQLQNSHITVAGYPGEKANIPCSVPWYAVDKVVEAFPKVQGKLEDLLHYQADTSAGMSGSPVWMKGKDGRYYLVAVHSSFLDVKKAGKERQVNVGALVTKEMIRQLRIWKVRYLQILFTKNSTL